MEIVEWLIVEDANENPFELSLNGSDATAKVTARLQINEEK